MSGQVPCAALPLAARAQLRGATHIQLVELLPKALQALLWAVPARGGACAARRPGHPRPCCSTTEPLLPLCHCPLAPDQRELVHGCFCTPTSLLETAPNLQGPLVLWVTGMVLWLCSTSGSWGKGPGQGEREDPCWERSMTGPRARTPHPVQSARLGHSGPGLGSGCQMGGVQGRGLPAAKSHCSN